MTQDDDISYLVPHSINKCLKVLPPRKANFHHINPNSVSRWVVLSGGESHCYQTIIMGYIVPDGRINPISGLDM